MPTDVELAIDGGDIDKVVLLASTWTEPRRRVEAPALAVLYRKIKKERAGVWDHATYAKFLAASLAVLATSSLSEIKALSLSVRDDRAYDVLVARRPPWLGEWCEWSLRPDAPDWRVANWSVVRRMVREGLVDRPTFDMYFLWVAELAGRSSVKDFLLADPGLLEYEVWQLFRIEGNAGISLTNVEKYSRSKWMSTLIDLSNEGILSRDRLLDASLEALSNDFPEFRSGWFSRFHEALTPTIDERAARADRYLDLVASKIPPTVAFALNAVAILDRAQALTPSRGIEAIAPAFHAAEKKTVMLGLKLLSTWVKREPDLSTRAVDTVRPALEHGARDVREAVAAFVTTQGHPVSTPVSSPIVDAAIPAAEVASLPAKSEVVEPISTVEELVDVFSRVIENEGPPDDLERVMDGVSRLCDVRPADFDRLTSPLRKRARSLIADTWPTCFQGYSVKGAFCGLATAWLAGELPPPSTRPNARGIGSFLGARVGEAAERIQRREPRELLAAPTHSGGWIDPGTLVDRLCRNDGADLDIIQALLRLGRNGREDALKAASTIAGEVGEAVRHALGAEHVNVGPSGALWAAASRARDPENDDPLVAARHGGLGPDTGLIGRIEFGWRTTESTYSGTHTFGALTVTPDVPATVAVEFPTLLIYKTVSPDALTLRWAMTVWPAYRESWCAAGCVALGNNLDWWGAEWGNKVYLEPLLHSEMKLTGMGGLLLGLGLAAKDPGEGTLAVDILLAGMSDGAIDPALLGPVLARLFSWDQIKLPRVTSRLMQASRSSGNHARTIYSALADALTIGPPKDSGALGTALELLYELTLSTTAPPVSGPLRDYLAGIKGSNRAASIARKLVRNRAE